MRDSNNKPQWAQNKVYVIDDGELEEYNVGELIEDLVDGRLYYDKESAEAFLASDEGIQYMEEEKRYWRESIAKARAKGAYIMVADDVGVPRRKYI